MSYMPDDFDNAVNRAIRWAGAALIAAIIIGAALRAIEGITLAAPKQIPFGTRVSFPQLRGVVGTGKFVVQDRGAGASILHSPEWFDVFVDNKQRMKQFMRLPEFLEYEIEGQQSNQHSN